MPSIMPEGAIMSAPARAWLTACSARSGRVASLSTSSAAADFRQRATVAVVGVFAEAQVGDHQEIGRDSPGDPDRLLNDPVIARGGRAACVFVLGDSEEEDRRDAQLGRFGDGFAEPVERELVLARHRRDFAPKVLAVINEQRIDQVVDGETRFTDHAREAADDRAGVGADEADNRRRAGRSSRDSQDGEGEDGRAGGSTAMTDRRAASNLRFGTGIDPAARRSIERD